MDRIGVGSITHAGCCWSRGSRIGCLGSRGRFRSRSRGKGLRFAGSRSARMQNEPSAPQIVTPSLSDGKSKRQHETQLFLYSLVPTLATVR